MLMCAKQNTIDIIFNPIQHGRTKYIEIDQYFIKQKVEDKKIELIYVRSDEWMIDLLMKGLTKQWFWLSKRKLSMVQDHT